MYRLPFFLLYCAFHVNKYVEPISLCVLVWMLLRRSWQISSDGLLLHKPLIGPSVSLHSWVTSMEGEERVAVRRNRPTFVIVWDNVAFHHSHAVTEWFAAHPRMVSLFLPPYPPFLNPIEELFSSWRWKVYDHHPHDQMSLLDAMNAGCLEILSYVHCPRWHKMWSEWEPVAKCSR